MYKSQNDFCPWIKCLIDLFGHARFMWIMRIYKYYINIKTDLQKRIYTKIFNI